MKKNLNWQLALAVCIFVLLAINALTTMKLLLDIQKSQEISVQYESLPCKAVPVQFVIEEPECAEKLLRLMNITNVHIMPAEDFEPLWHRTTVGSQNQSEENE